jgi:hypothetical protein
MNSFSFFPDILIGERNNFPMSLVKEKEKENIDLSFVSTSYNGKKETNL